MSELTMRPNPRLHALPRVELQPKGEHGGKLLSSLQPPGGSLILSRAPHNRHTILIRRGNPAAEARTARQAGNCEYAPGQPHSWMQ